VVNVKLRRFDGTRSDVMVRGVSPVFWQVVGDNMHLAHGRIFKPGLRELITGAGAAGHFVTLDTGGHVLIRKTPWHVVGQFTAGGSLWESELWTDIGSLRSAWNAPGDTETSLWVKLTSPAAYNAFAAALRTNASLKGLHVERQRDYYRFQVGFIYRYTRIAAWGISILLGIAVVLTIANALYMALTARRRETALLRAVGFKQIYLALAMLIEVIVIGAVCACFVILIGWLALNGRSISSATFFQSIDFSLSVSPPVAFWTILYTVLLGIVAALLPIARAVRAPLTRALQEE
jgi:putative ABC transport system permease protein